MKQLTTFTFALSVLSSGAADITMPFIPIDPDPRYVLQTANPVNPNGIEFGWYGHALRDPNQRTLESFRQEMVIEGRLAGGPNWDAFTNATVIANQTGVAWDFSGLPGSLRIVATTSGNPLKVSASITPWAGPSSGSNVIGGAAVTDGCFESTVSRELTLDVQTSQGLELRGFGMALVNSGWDAGGLTLSFYNGNTLLDRFYPSDGVLFHDQSTDDNFVGYWSDTPITRIHMQTDDSVLRGRFDDLAFVLVPEPRMSIRVSEVEVCWTSGTNATYRVEYRSDLTTNTWTTLRECVPNGGSETCIYDKVLPGEPQRFYRVVVTNCVPGI